MHCGRLLVSSALTVAFCLHTLVLLLFEQRYNVDDYRSNRSTTLSTGKIDRCRRNESINDDDDDRKEPDCPAVLAGDRRETCRLSRIHRKAEDDQSIIDDLLNGNWTEDYPRTANSDEERDFPIAYSISIYKNVGQFRRLLEAIYWPQNLYCIHVDRRSDQLIHRSAAIIASAFDNVFVAQSEPVYWAGYGVLKAAVNCLNESIDRFPDHRWRYVINLSGMDFPLKTNLEIVRILTVLNGSNDVEFDYEWQFSRYWFSYRSILDQRGLPYTHTPDVMRRKPPAPHHLKVYKGNLAAVLSRKFVDYLINDRMATELIDWLSDTDTADEHLWSTLNHNSVANAPGNYPIDCHFRSEVEPYIARYAKWRSANGSENCGGKYVRDVCVFGVEDLHRLIRSDRPELFVNKLYSDYQSAALLCLEHWHRDKVRRNIVQVNLTHYENLPNVIYNRYRTAHPDGPLCPPGKISKMGDYALARRKYVRGSVSRVGRL